MKADSQSVNNNLENFEIEKDKESISGSIILSDMNEQRNDSTRFSKQNVYKTSGLMSSVNKEGDNEGVGFGLGDEKALGCENVINVNIIGSRRNVVFGYDESGIKSVNKSDDKNNDRNKSKNIDINKSGNGSNDKNDDENKNKNNKGERDRDNDRYINNNIKSRIIADNDRIINENDIVNNEKNYVINVNTVNRRTIVKNNTDKAATAATAAAQTTATKTATPTTATELLTTATLEVTKIRKGLA